MSLSVDLQFMKRALELAAKGMGSVSPNPMVGCVIVHEGEVIGEGWHERYGEAHAEVRAIKSVKKKSLLKESTMYVTLEPCAHHGKTPACTGLIMKHKVQKVVISNLDPFPLVNGEGMKVLEEAGIEVELGMLSDEGRELNKRYFTRLEKKRPYVILKWAETADGLIARENYDSKWISNEASRKMVHQWRAEEDAIWVGTNTAKYDNPILNVREVEGHDPIRLVIDKHLSLDPKLNLFNQEIPTVCYNYKQNRMEDNLEWVKIEEGFELQSIFMDLRQRGVQSVLVEGGTVLIDTIIDLGFWDEARVFKCNEKFEKGIAAPKLGKDPVSIEDIKGDALHTYIRVQK